MIRGYQTKQIRFMVVCQAMAWQLSALEGKGTASIVLVMDTERFEVKEQRTADYTIPEVLHLQSMACEPI